MIYCLVSIATVPAVNPGSSAFIYGKTWGKNISNYFTAYFGTYKLTLLLNNLRRRAKILPPVAYLLSPIRGSKCKQEMALNQGFFFVLLEYVTSNTLFVLFEDVCVVK